MHEFQRSHIKTELDRRMSAAEHQRFVKQLASEALWLRVLGFAQHRVARAQSDRAAIPSDEVVAKSR